MGLWGSFMWATSIMVHFSKSIASQLGGLPLMGFRSKKRSKKRGMQQRRRHLADTGSTPSAALSPCSTSVGRTQPLAAAVARAEASWLLRDLQKYARDAAIMTSSLPICAKVVHDLRSLPCQNLAAHGTKGPKNVALETWCPLCEFIFVWLMASHPQHALNMRDEAAMSRVGSMLMAGYGTKQDPEEAALWMREA
eukprot:104851-Pelagomonas_calceolata.AAC.1